MAFGHTLRDTARWIRAQFERPYLAATLPKRSEYVFTADFVSWQTAIWEEWLAPLKNKPGVRFLEIGSFEGRSAIWLLDHILTHPTARLTCVDCFRWAAYEMRFDHNIRLSGHASKVLKRKGSSADVLATLSGQRFDAGYVDGGHRAAEVLMDAISVWPLLEPGGILIFDDYAWELQRSPLERPQLGVDLFLRALAGEIEVLHRDYQMIVRKRPTDSAGRYSI